MLFDRTVTIVRKNGRRTRIGVPAALDTVRTLTIENTTEVVVRANARLVFQPGRLVRELDALGIDGVEISGELDPYDNSPQLFELEGTPLHSSTGLAHTEVDVFIRKAGSY